MVVFRHRSPMPLQNAWFSADQAHLLTLVDALDKTAQAGTHADTLHTLLDELTPYLTGYICRREAAMSVAGIRKLHRFRQEHAALLNRLRRIRQFMLDEHGEPASRMEAISNLRDTLHAWLSSHVGRSKPLPATSPRHRYISTHAACAA